jgi:hypothetical protein
MASSDDALPADTSTKQAQPVPPPALLCPITLSLFRDPVVATSGHTYERSAIKKAWRRKPGLDPLTGVVVKSRRLSLSASKSSRS